MPKPKKEEEIAGILTITYEAFYLSKLPIGTTCVITNESNEKYTVRFPDVIGYSGTFQIKKTGVNKNG